MKQDHYYNSKNKYKKTDFEEMYFSFPQIEGPGSSPWSTEKILQNLRLMQELPFNFLGTGVLFIN